MPDTPIKVHITGVYGLFGNVVYSHLAGSGEFDVYGSGRRTLSSDRADADQRSQLPESHFSIADLSDADTVDAALEAADAVLHIGAVPDPSSCRTYADAHDVSTICLRIGWVNREDAASGVFSNSIWCSHRDIASSFDLALRKTAESGVYDICYALSDGPYRWVDLEHTRTVTGFVPQDGGG